MEDAMSDERRHYPELTDGLVAGPAASCDGHNRPNLRHPNDKDLESPEMNGALVGALLLFALVVWIVSTSIK